MTNNGTKMEVLKKIQLIKTDSIIVCISDHEERFCSVRVTMLLFLHPIALLCSASSLSRVQLFATPWTAAREAPLAKEFSRLEHWSGLLCPALGDLSNSRDRTQVSLIANGFFTV